MSADFKKCLFIVKMLLETQFKVNCHELRHKHVFFSTLLMEKKLQLLDSLNCLQSTLIDDRKRLDQPGSVCFSFYF